MARLARFTDEPEMAEPDRTLHDKLNELTEAVKLVLVKQEELESLVRDLTRRVGMD